MRVNHLPDGSFKRILQHRRNFPKISRHELTLHNIERDTEIADLRTIPYFSELCTFIDRLCDFLKIPPINLYWAPDTENHPYPKAFLTPFSNSVLFVKEIDLIKMHIIEALGAHEIGHGLQGDIEAKSWQDGDLGKFFRHLREYRSDMFAALMTSPSAAASMLSIFELYKSFLRDARNYQDVLDASSAETDDHPPVMLRRISIIGMELDSTWQNLVMNSRRRKEILTMLYDKEPKDRGLDLFADEIDRSRLNDVMTAAPFHHYFAK